MYDCNFIVEIKCFKKSKKNLSLDNVDLDDRRARRFKDRQQEAEYYSRSWSRHSHIKRVRIIILNSTEKGTIFLNFVCPRFLKKGSVFGLDFRIFLIRGVSFLDIQRSHHF